MPTFIPNKHVKPERGYINFDVTVELHTQIKEKAKMNNLSVRQFIVQAVKFAIENMEKDKGHGGR